MPALRDRWRREENEVDRSPDPTREGREDASEMTLGEVPRQAWTARSGLDGK